MNSIITPTAEAKKEARRQIERAVRSRYEEERKSAGFWRRELIWFKVQIEIEKEMKRKFPPRALYATDFAR